MGSQRVSMNVSGVDVNAMPAIIDGDISISYHDYHRLAGAMAEKLKTEGVEAKQRVGIIAANSMEYIITLMALLHLGAVACPISTRYPSGTIEKMLSAIGCRKVIAAPEFVFDSGGIRWIPMLKAEALDRPENILNDLDMDQDATIIFTSGSADVPKAVLHSFGNHYYSALGSNLNIELKSGDRWLLSLPLYHVGGLGIVFRCLLAGATVVIGRDRQDISGAVKEFGITHLSLVSTQLQALLDQTRKREFPGTVKSVLVGGGFVPGHLIEKAVAAGLPIYTTYGSTEMASQVTTTGPNETGDKLCTSGKVLKYRELKLSADGEIKVRGDTLFNGYITSSGIQHPFDSEGWYATGDLGDIDGAGYLTVTGRKDNMFISGGENIYPEEIEAAMRLLDGVEDAVVVPTDDARYGQRPVAFVKMSKATSLVPEILIKELLAHLPKFKIPEQILSWPGDVPQAGIKPDRLYFKRLVKDTHG